MGGGVSRPVARGQRFMCCVRNPKKHKRFRPGARPGGIGFPAGRIGDRGDREIVYVPNVYVPFPAPRFCRTLGARPSFSGPGNSSPNVVPKKGPGFGCLNKAKKKKQSSEGREGGLGSIVVEFGTLGAPRFSVQRSQNPLKQVFWDLWTENRGAPKTPTNSTPHSP